VPRPRGVADRVPAGVLHLGRARRRAVPAAVRVRVGPPGFGPRASAAVPNLFALLAGGRPSRRTARGPPWAPRSTVGSNAGCSRRWGCVGRPGLAEASGSRRQGPSGAWADSRDVAHRWRARSRRPYRGNRGPMHLERHDSLVVASRMPPLVGRDAELDHLARLLSAAEAGEPQLVVVQGPPGIGKTRLAGEFADPAPP